MTALQRCKALEGLASFGGRRAIFFRAAPNDACFDGPRLPQCVFDWRESGGGLRCGTLTIELLAARGGDAVPEDMARTLARELDGMAFGGDVAHVLCWRVAEGLSGGETDPDVTGAAIELDAYAFARGGALQAALEQAVGGLLGSGYVSMHALDNAGERPDAAPYCVRVTAMQRGSESAACRWRSFTAALHIPHCAPEGVEAAFDALSGAVLLGTDMGGVLVEQLKLAETDGCAQGQITLRGRFNALTEQPTQPLMRAEVGYGDGATRVTVDARLHADEQTGG